MTDDPDVARELHRPRGTASARILLELGVRHGLSAQDRERDAKLSPEKIVDPLGGIEFAQEPAVDAEPDRCAPAPGGAGTGGREPNCVSSPPSMRAQSRSAARRLFSAAPLVGKCVVRPAMRCRRGRGVSHSAESTSSAAVGPRLSAGRSSFSLSQRCGRMLQPERRQAETRWQPSRLFSPRERLSESANYLFASQTPYMPSSVRSK